MNCLTYALPLWHKYGGHLQLRKSKELDVAHVVWISPEGKMLHYAPKSPRKKNWRHLFLLCTGFDGVVRTTDDIDPKPMRLRGLLLSAYISAFVVTWFCIKELFIRLVGTINMKQVLIAIDQTVNTLVWAKDEGFGMADETLSARMWRLGVLEGNKNWYAAMKIVDSIFFWDKETDESGNTLRHCELSYISELQRSQLPSHYSKISQN